jgi:predicted outer membrane repeat protein
MNVNNAHTTPAHTVSARSIFIARRGAGRTAAAVASTGLLVGMGAIGASPAIAVTAADCTDANTVTAPAGAADIQSLLDSDTPIVCLSGTFTLATPLEFDYDLTLLGLTADTILDGNGATRILESTRGTLAIHNLSFVDAAALGDFEFGGAVSTDGDVDIFGSHFSGNFGRYGGGAVFADGNVSIIDSTFVDNDTEPQSDGGAVLAEGEISVINSTFDGNGNGATNRGGALFAEGNISSDGSTFTGNTSADGGALYSLGSVDVSNSTFVSNSATDEGGAILARGGDVGFSTFLNNTAATPVGGADIPGEAIYLELSYPESDLILRGNIFAGSGQSPQIGVGGPAGGEVREAENNVFSTTSALEEDLIERTGTSIFGASIFEIFGASSPVLGNNGGITETVALFAGSPAVDLVERVEVVFPFGSLTPADVGDITDQRGEPRVGLLDAGAFEFQLSDAVTPAPAPAPELAATGSAPISSVLGGFAALIIAVGAAFVAMARRQRVG